MSFKGEEVKIVPVVNVNLLEGRTEEQKRKIVEGFCKVLMEEAGAKKESITVLINDYSKENIGKGDKLMKDL